MFKNLYWTTLHIFNIFKAKVIIKNQAINDIPTICDDNEEESQMFIQTPKYMPTELSTPEDSLPEEKSKLLTSVVVKTAPA